MTDKITIDNSGQGFSEVLKTAEQLAVDKGLDQKQQSDIRLLAEETMELVRNISDEFRAEVQVTIDDRQFEMRLYSEASMDSERRDHLHEIVYGKDETREVSGKIKAVLESRYYDESGENEEFLDQMGVQKIEAAEINDGNDSDEEEYIWSLQNYGFKTFDNHESSLESETDWAEIGRSIIANLADDFRIYIFRDHRELIVTRHIHESLREYNQWAIDPELEDLKKVPVPRTRIQVKMIQLLYRNLHNKEKSDDDLTVDKITIPTQTSPRKKMGCMVYIPRGKENEVLPTVLLLHGGAMVLPALPYHYRLARTIARETGGRVFMPLYDLAPTHKPPIQHKEAAEAYGYLLKNAVDLHIDPSRVVLVGDSAGGTLCAALCLILRDMGKPMPFGQVLLYPSLDARLTSESMQLYTDVPIVNAKAVKFYYKICSHKKSARKGNRTWAKAADKNTENTSGKAADKAEDKATEKAKADSMRGYTSPVEAVSLEGMPPTYVETAEFDCLHDDGILYADRLAREDCKVVLNETKGTVHAYDMAENSTVLKKSMKRRTDFINELFRSNQGSNQGTEP